MVAIYRNTLLTCLFLLALVIPSMGQTPVYNEYEVGKLRAFLEQKNTFSGKKNGEVLNTNYNPDDPTTYGAITWSSDAVNRTVRVILWHEKFLTGDLNLSNFTKLEELHAYQNKLNSVDVSGCTSLTILNASNNNFTSVSVDGCINLRHINCGSEYLTNLQISALPRLEELVVNWSNLSVLSITDCPNLVWLDCRRNKLTSLDLSGFPNLRALQCSLNQLKEVNFSGCQKLRSLECREANLSAINVSMLTSLENLDVYGNNLSSLNLPAGAPLKQLVCENNMLKISTLPNVQNLTTFTYSPQKKILIGRDAVVNGVAVRYIKDFEGVDLSTERVVNGNSTVYTWRKSSDNSVVTPLTSENGVFTFSENVSGQSIYCELTNSTFPNFVGQNALKTETVIVEGRYNTSDVVKLKTFLQQESAIFGQKNYQRIGLEVDIDDPSSWPLVEWTASSTNKRIKSIIWMRKDLAGNLDFSGLDSLKSVELTTNKIASANFYGCTKLEKIWLDENTITAINTSTLANLKELNVNYNKIEQLDLSANTQLEEAEFASNLLSTVKLPNTATLGSIRATRNNFKLSTLPSPLSQYYSYFYQPQNPMVIGDAVQENGKTIYKIGSYTTVDLSSELTVGGKTTTYSWYNVSKKTDITPKTSANGKFSFDSSVEGDTLICYMRNESFPDFSMLYPFETVKVLVVPGYNQYEVGKLKAFLDQPSGREGITNGKAINENYNPDDPRTYGIEWSGKTSIDKTVTSIRWWYKLVKGELDLSNFRTLSEVSIEAHYLSSLNLSGDKDLTSLGVGGNYGETGKKIKELNLSDCINLVSVNCDQQDITSIDVSRLSKLKSLSVRNNKIEKIDVSNNLNLQNLYCSYNKIRMSKLPAKSQFYVYDYAPQIIDVGRDTICFGKTLKYVDVDKEIDLSSEYFIEGKETIFIWKKVSDNTVVIPKTSNGGRFTFGQNLNGIEVYCEMTNPVWPYFKDQNVAKTVNLIVGRSFDRYNKEDLEKLKAFLNRPSSKEGKTNGQVVNSKYNSDDPSTYGVTWSYNLNVNKRAVSISWEGDDLNGVLNLSNMPELNRVRVSWGNIESVDVGNCVNLTYAQFHGNNLKTINVSGCANLEFLQCSYNSLTSIDLSSNLKIKELHLWSNSISALDVRMLKDLTVLYVNENNLTSLTVNQDAVFKNGDISKNQFKFSSLAGLPSNMSSFKKVPQRDLEIGDKVNKVSYPYYVIGKNAVLDLSSEYSIKGNITNYVWKESYTGNEIKPTISDNGKFTFDNSFNNKAIYCEMYNNAYPEFAGSNRMKTVVVGLSDKYLQSEVDVIKEFLNRSSAESGKTNGQQVNALYNPNDPSTYGVTWSNHTNGKRVVRIEWANKKLAGDLDFNNFEMLDELYISNNKITSLNFLCCFCLTSIEANSNEISKCTIGANSKLEYLDLANNKMTYFRIGDSPKLSYLFVNDNKLAALDVSLLKGVTRIKIYNNEISSIDVSGLSELLMLRAECNKLTSVKFENNSNLVLVNLDKNLLPSIDLSNLNSLNDLTISNNLLAFSKIPQRESLLERYVYAPQRSFPVGHSKQDGDVIKYFIYAEEPLDLSSELNIGGNVTTFVWKKVDGTVVKPISSNNGVFKFSTDLIGEVIYGELSNNSFPDFTGDKVFKTVQFTVQSPYNEGEVAKLVNFFGRPSSNGTTNGRSIGITKMNNPGSWQGVEWTSEVSDRRVTSINWTSLGIADTLNVSDFIRLTSIDVADNKLDKIMSGNTPFLKRGFFGNNRLNFSTMPICTIFDEYSCFPQEKLEIGKKTDDDNYTLLAGEYVDLSSEIVIESQATTFTWKDDAGNVVMPTMTEKGRFAFNRDFVGKKLYCVLSNDKFPGGTLQTVLVSIPSSSFEKKFGEEVNIVVYPNPTSSVLKVEIDEVIRTYNIYSISGVLVKTGSINDFRAEISVQNLTSGTYLLELSDGTKVYRSKFIKK